MIFLQMFSSVGNSVLDTPLGKRRTNNEKSSGIKTDSQYVNNHMQLFLPISMAKFKGTYLLVLKYLE